MLYLSFSFRLTSLSKTISWCKIYLFGTDAGLGWLRTRWLAGTIQVSLWQAGNEPKTKLGEFLRVSDLRRKIPLRAWKELCDEVEQGAHLSQGQDGELESEPCLFFLVKIDHLKQQTAWGWRVLCSCCWSENRIEDFPLLRTSKGNSEQMREA